MIKKIDEYDNALDINVKIRNYKMKISDVKNDQIDFKSYLSEIK